MRIAVLMSVLSPWSRVIAEMLARLGHEIHAIDFDAAKGSYLRDDARQKEIDAFAANIAAVHELRGYGASNLRYFKAVPEFRRLLKRLQPQMLLTLYAGGFAQMAWLSRFRPYTIFAVGSDVLLQTGLRRRIARITFEAAAHVFANGLYLADQTRLMAPRAKITPLLHGIDVEKFKPSPTKAEPVTLLCNRGFKNVYNNDYIIEALARLGDVPPFQFNFAASGELLETSKALAARILPPKIRDSVKFWGGVSHSQVLEMLGGARYFVSMSKSDGTATSLLEALSCGLCPILSDIPQNRDWVIPERNNGRIIPLGNVDALAAALREAIVNPALADNAASFNRQLILDRGDARANLRRMSDMLEKAA